MVDTLSHYLGKIIEIWLIKSYPGQPARIRGKVSNYDTSYLVIDNPLVPTSAEEWGPFGHQEMIIPAGTISYIVPVES